ncbi:MAG: pyridoxal phosphate-dependent aminotransferase [bacterium]
MTFLDMNEISDSVRRVFSATTTALSANIDGIARSATLAILERVQSARASGRHVIDLGIGEPSFATPRFISEAAERAIAEGRTRYTAVEGIVALREAIAAEAQELSAGRRLVDKSEVVVTSGSKQALFESCFVLFGPGDDVLIPSPAWPSYAEMVRLARATPVAVAGDHTRGWKVDVHSLRASATPRTRGLILGSPMNPSGAVYDIDELRAIAALAAERGWWIISDEIYRPLSYDGDAPSILAACAPDAEVVSVGGVAKAYAMTGWRIGWVIAPRMIASAMIGLQSHITSNATTISQYAALAAISSKAEAEVAQREMLAALRVRRDLAVSALARVYPDYVKPAGAFYCFLPIGDRTAGASADFVLSLLHECDVAVVPGSAFGTEGWVRASFAGSDDDVRSGFGSLADFLQTRNG